MKKRIPLFCMVVLMLLGVTAFGALTAFAAESEADAHGWNRRVNDGTAIDIKTNTQTGYSDIRMLYANGAYNVRSLDVEKPFHLVIRYDGLGSDWGPAFMLSDNPTAVNHFSGAGSKPVVGYNENPQMPHGWQLSKIQWCSPKQTGESPIRLRDAASTGFYNGTDGSYDADKAAAAERNNVRVNLGSAYDFFFEIEEKIGDEELQTGSRLTLTETRKDGTTAQDVYYLQVKRDDFEHHKAYLGMAAVAHSNDYLSMKIARRYTLFKDVAVGDITELYINGVEQDVANSAFNAYYGDELKFKVTGDNVLVKAGKSLEANTMLAQGEDGYYHYYMGNYDTDIVTEQATQDYCSVSYDTDGGSSIYAVKVTSGTVVARPQNDPVKEGMIFKGWYMQDLTTPYDFAKPVTANTVVYAKWSALCHVTYHLEAFGARVKEVETGATFPQPTLHDFHIFGRSNNKQDYADVNSLEVEWFSDENCSTPFDFQAKVTGPIDVYGKLTETKRYAYTQAHGWDSVRSLKDSYNTVFMDSAFARTIFDCREDGTVTYNFTTPQNFGLYSRGLDVTKPVKMDVQLGNGTKNGWTIFSFYNVYTLAQLAEAEGYDSVDSGSCIGFGLSPTTGEFLTEGHDTPKEEYGDRIKEYSAGTKVKFVIYIGETTADSYITIDGERAIELGVTRADFADGLMYANISAFASQQARVKLYQDIDYTVGEIENGSIQVTQNGAFVVLKATPNDGYALESVKINGKQVAYEAESDYAELADDEVLLVIEDYKSGVVTATFSKSGGDGGNGGGTEKKGCGGDLAASGCGMAGGLMLLGAAAALLRKKKEARTK